MTRNPYEAYYLNQAGSGLPVFVGSRHAKGHGIGNVLSGLVRLAVPMLKRTGKAVMKEGLRTGLDVLHDVVGGENIKSSVQRRARQTGSRLVKRAANNIGQQLLPALPPPPGRKKKRAIKRRLNARKTQSSKKRRRDQDIFG